jgi:hypothetical protein
MRPAVLLFDKLMEMKVTAQRDTDGRPCGIAGTRLAL